MARLKAAIWKKARRMDRAEDRMVSIRFSELLIVPLERAS